jgi:hypothetical protein
MKNLIAAIIGSITLSGCVVYPAQYAEPYPSTVQTVECADGGVCTTTTVVYTVGYYRPGFGYWTGYGWDFEFYAYGHPGYGFHYNHIPEYGRPNYREHYEHRYVAPPGRVHHHQH